MVSGRRSTRSNADSNEDGAVEAVRMLALCLNVLAALAIGSAKICGHVVILRVKTRHLCAGQNPPPRGGFSL